MVDLENILGTMFGTGLAAFIMAFVAIAILIFIALYAYNSLA